MRIFLIFALFLIILPVHASVITLTFSLDQGKYPITGNLDWYAVSPNGQININSYCGFESKQVTVTTSPPLNVDCTLTSLDIPGSSKPLEIFAEVRSGSGLLRTKDTYKPDVKLTTKSAEDCSKCGSGYLGVDICDREECQGLGKCIYTPRLGEFIGGDCKSCVDEGISHCEDYSKEYLDECVRNPCLDINCNIDGKNCVELESCPQIPYYEPDKWNLGVENCVKNNCYNYATDIMTYSFAVPGRASGAEFASVSCSEIIPAAEQDGLVYLGLNKPSAIEDCLHLVALVVNGYDFHWIRQDNSGFWSHKQGSSRASEVDNAKNKIVNPEKAEFGYPSFCGYFAVDKRKVVLE